MQNWQQNLMFKAEEKALFNALYEPTVDEFCGMVDKLLAKYDESDLRLLTDTSPEVWRGIRSGWREPCRLVKRIIWMLYMIEHAPDRLLSGSHSLCMWGKNAVALPRMSDLSVKERIPIMRDFVRAARDNNHNYSADEIASLCKVPIAAVKSVCAELGYEPTTHEIVDVYEPGSIWYRMDWRKSNKYLARKFNLPESTIAHVRHKMATIPPAIAARNIYRTVGSDYDYFWVLWDNAKQVEVYVEACKYRDAERAGAETTIFIDSQ